MSKDEKEICIYCRWWAPRKVGVLTVGNCRVKAPRLIKDEGDDFHKAEWPATSPDDFCGEFKERSE